MERVYNFNAGPSAMPLSVLQTVQRDFLDFNHTGMSIVEISHRSAAYQELQADTIALLKKVMRIPDGYHIVFLQGGGSMQFLMHGANFLKRRGAYVNTGVWATKAMEAAAFFGPVYEAASGKKEDFGRIPEIDAIHLQNDTDYLYITSNNTIYGTEWQQYPHLGLPLICDASSDFLARPVHVADFDLLYAGVQKNVGPAGAVVAIIKDTLLQQARTDIPVMLQYRTFVEHDSTYNTPPVFAIYFVNQVLHWIDRNGGLTAMEMRNRQKAAIVYDAIDRSNGFYRGHAAVNSRSLMNVTFRLATPELEKAFVAAGAARRLIGLKGHRSLGGCRASIYNAVTVEACEVLAEFMDEFRKRR
ncbi:3-phosphoserine/phosphohydroxythreonine transaminase [Megasphaera vaginalis (ex Bordigoni et al. 2020)]|uniref:3-phosphoserine/phosphohydroxythreonine transaminase n=1 Tax=Megasphaera vaginalis (ex Bordigoni et al. 2020) TaxID=2045301 RepID=UPI000C79EC3F|nr:3-phosphoserine/phosphohydroxythreonine transaminase [Megasphaera vaginalis (ex Bordigoni et al. 2020)]